MAIQTRPPYGVQRAVIPGGEKFMGMAEQVRPQGVRALPAPTPTVSPPTVTPAAAVPAPAAAVPAPAAAAASGGKAYNVGKAIGSMAGKAAPYAKALGVSTLATAPLTGFGDFKINDPDVDSSALAVPTIAGLRKGAVEAGLDSINGLAKTADWAGGLVGANPGLSDSFINKVRSDMGAGIRTPQTQADRAAEAAKTAPGAAIAAPAVQTPTQGAATPPKLAGTDLGGGVRRVNTNGSTLYTNASSDTEDQRFMASKGGTVSTVGNLGEANAINQRALDVMKQMRAMREGQLDQGDIGAYAEAAGQQPGGVNAELQRQIKRLSGVRTSSANAQIGQLLGVQAQLRNQDLDSSDRRAGLEQNARIAGMTARQKQMQDDRAFGLQEKELGVRMSAEQRMGGEALAKRDVENFTQRQAAAKAVTERFTAAATGPDGVVDKKKEARYTEGAMQVVANRQAALEQEIAKNGPNAAQAKEELAMLQNKGIASLDEQRMAEIISQLDLGDRAQETSGVFGGKGVRSKNPDDYKVTGRKQNLFGSDTLILGNGKGGSIRENDALYAKPGNFVVPNSWDNTLTNDFDLAKKGVR